MRILIMAIMAALLSGCSMNSWKSPNTPEVHIAKPEPICTNKDKQAIDGYFFRCIDIVCASPDAPKQQGDVPYCTRNAKGRIQSLHVRAFSAVSICIDAKAQILGVKLENCQNYISDILKHQGDES